MSEQEFEMLRDSLTIAARRMSKDQVFDLCDALRQARKRREESASWDDARDRSVFGFT